MNSRIKKIGFYIILVSLFTSCQDDDEMSFSNSPCGNDPLEIISDDKDCDSEFFLVCEAVEVDDVNNLEVDDFDWIPMLCDKIGETIKYKNEKNESFDITITSKDHYINKERTNASCDNSIEHVSYICQSNETAFIEFSSSIFGQNITRFELFSQIDEVKNGQLGNSKLHFTLGQPRFNSNVHNFLYRVTVGEEYDTRSRGFHKDLTLNEIEFNDVYELKVRESYWDEPHISVYINQDHGILGFKESNKFWLRDN